MAPKPAPKKKPAAKQSAAKQPAAKQPAAKKPAAKKPAAKKPAATQRAARPPASRPGAPKQPAPPEPPTAHTAAADFARDLLKKLPPLDAQTRDAFASQVTAAEVARLGGQTHAISVLRESATWLVQVGQARERHDELRRRYGDARFAYLCERVLALDEQLGRDGEKDDAVRTVHFVEADARRHAQEALAHVLGALEPVVRGRPDEAGLVAAARRGVPDDALPARLRDLARLARKVLGRAENDPKTRALVASFGLGEDDAAESERAAATLDAARDATRDAGTRHAGDSAAANLLEGILLSELRVVLGVFRAARETNPGLPVLIPGVATRPVLARSHHARPAQKHAAAAARGAVAPEKSPTG